MEISKELLRVIEVQNCREDGVNDVVIAAIDF